MADNKKEQFSLIYDQYIDKIYRFIYLKVSSPEIAEDLTSKVFLRGWESYQKQREIKNIKAFLYQIARNIVVDHYRSLGRTKMVSMDNVAQIADKKSTSYEQAVQNADIEAVKAAIKNLHKDYQDIIIWYYLEDMPASEIADLLRKPPGTVRVMIHRGLEMLKKKLQ